MGSSRSVGSYSGEGGQGSGGVSRAEAWSDKEEAKQWSQESAEGVDIAFDEAIDGEVLSADRNSAVEEGAEADAPETKENTETLSGSGEVMEQDGGDGEEEEDDDGVESSYPVAADTIEVDAETENATNSPGTVNAGDADTGPVEARELSELPAEVKQEHNGYGSSMQVDDSGRAVAVEGGLQSSTEKEVDLVVPQTHEIVIPSYAKWFHLNKIHEIEKKSLPEFFTNRIPSKTPQVYVKYRNFMVNSYRLNPNEYFTVTSARRNLCGDAGSIFRVYKFLSKWGLINYQVNSKVKPTAVEPPYTGEYSTRHDAPRGLFPFQSYKPAVQIPDMSRLKKMMTQLRDPITGGNRQESSPSLKTEAGEEQAVDGKRMANGISTGHLRAPKKPRLQDMIDKDWEKGEVIKLLKSLQQHGTDWMQVAKDVGNKTPEQCILRFLQLPIEDNFLDSEENLGPLKYGAHLPFSKADNPVMSTIAFLVGLVDAETVRAMTQRAIKSIDGEEVPSANGTSDETPARVVKDASEIAVASLGARAHVFANNEERALNAVTNELVHTQLRKVDLKLKLLDTMEKSLEVERKALQKQQEEVFLQRFSFSKYAINVLEKFEQALKDTQDPAVMKDNINAIRKMILNPPEFAMGSSSAAPTDMSSGGAHETPGAAAPEGSVAALDITSVKPVSMDAPQLYRYWSG
ncbi:AEL135Cp [Eremothecium gossypii ATCC 10895]|uniref:AEL135Cp n=1 Tax=Eremothecium gossypii (strain ATCC 10895 / CBS 109.51 / FGSC 9923 / NRRL Y-1056) TaxID=284811 RepID=Q757Z5_EREGS|nr:AEL135Cp [Eremothecium gossypii ATCC 10895]AAS52550.2 AEL135Cp [Eremothecium gossypii ATCC 10895]AEY96850.1 FAEL135Cp [Eremothecium gossypii FDAG1]